MTDTTPLRLRVEALENKYETMRLATLEWGKDVDKLMRWSDQHLQRIMALEAGVTCPHVVTSGEDTSYCRLAEQTAARRPKPPSLTEQALEAWERQMSCYEETDPDMNTIRRALERLQKLEAEK